MAEAACKTSHYLDKNYRVVRVKKATKLTIPEQTNAKSSQLITTNT
jgi:hypothetical protein